ncbi:hypothetical protein JKP88DRAFT_259505 [Tribonema minus]|uniref:NADPH:adrenodoxin oxidoreductase, mitochondrial n=1 Tax=Tribonema minus TaxID=303371 RepID=A0A835ZC91_9STRA|nr:hypothetical protein JKP88DRAFT_259505 [Tribonema minus]
MTFTKTSPKSLAVLRRHSQKLQGSTAVRGLANRTLSACAAASDSPTSGNDKPPLRVCVVGSGPAGFYTTKYLLKEQGLSDRGITIDIVDRLPTPYGLVRSGVAPDHPEVKAAQNDFEQVASDPRVSFFGNVTVGSDVSVAQLRELYHAVVIAHGAGGDRSLGVPGEDLDGVLTARAFVNWYNGHPDCADLGPRIAAALRHSDTAVVIGVGNVALDCARILAKGADALRSTDIAAHALEALSAAAPKRIVVAGRRGAAQASFTIKELRELTRIELSLSAAQGVACAVREDELRLSDAAPPPPQDRAKQRIMALLGAVAEASKVPPPHSREVQLRFLLSPRRMVPSPADPARVGAIEMERTALVAADDGSGAVRAKGTGVTETIDCGLVLTSIGYRTLPLDDLPYDARRATVACAGGGASPRVENAPGTYCAGWARRGPSGIIGTNILDAKFAAAALAEDAASGALPGAAEARWVISVRSAAALAEDAALGAAGGGGRAVRTQALLSDSAVAVVDWTGYQRIDAAERARGAAASKPREKVVRVAEMLSLARGSGAD